MDTVEQRGPAPFSCIESIAAGAEIEMERLLGSSLLKKGMM